MAITNARIQMRRGLEKDFNPDEMTPGEWALSLDTKYVRMCFAPGECLRMATYEAFEQDMEEILRILAECRDIRTAVELIRDNVTEAELVIEDYVAQAKQYRDEAEQFRNEAFTTTPDGYADLVQNVADNTAKIDIITDKAELNIKNTASGETIHLTDSADSKVVEFGLYGKAEQRITTGAQLLELPDLTTIYLGLTLVVNGGKSKITGTSTGASTLWYLGSYDDTSIKMTLKAGTYTVIDCVLWSYDGTNHQNYTGTFTITEDLNITGVSTSTYASGITVTENRLPMLNLGSIALPWEPYTGGMTSPSPDYPQDIEVAGESYNLLENTAKTQTVSGVTYTVNDDDSVTANNTATAFSYFDMTVDLKAGSYILSGYPSKQTIANVMLQCFKNTTATYLGSASGTELLFELSEDATALVRIVINEGTSVDNLTFYPMIRKASVKNDRYMPYGVGSIEVKSVGKNRFPSETEIGTISPDTGVEAVDTTFVRTPFATIEGGDYELTLKGDSVNLRLFYYGSNKNYLGYKDLHSTANAISIDDNVKYFRARWTVSSNLSEIQLERGIATPYEPYKSTTATISTPDGIAGINGVYDEVVKYADGSGKRIQRIGKAVFDGSDDEGWYKDGKSRWISSSVKTLAKGGSTNALCSSYQIKTAGQTFEQNMGISIDAGSNICLYDSNHAESDVTTWKENLAENNVILYYELATPIITDLTAEEIAEIEKLHTFYPVTNISNDADCDMAVTYLADSKNYIDNQLAIQAQAQEEALLNMLLLMPDSVQASMIENDTNNLLNEAEV